MFHEAMMARAIQLAERGRYTTAPNPNVGCVITKQGQILAEGWHQRAGKGHAEVNALAQLSDSEVNGAECYVTLEPCSHTGKTPPCADALIAKGIRRVFIAMIDPNPQVAGKGVAKLIQAGIDVTVGLLEQEAEQLNRGFIKRMKTGMPLIRSKIAMSLDGRTAMDSGESQWITGADARQDVQKLRAQSGAIITGIGTVIADNPKMTVRDVSDYPETESMRQPLRLVVDSQLMMPEKAAILSPDTIIATSSEQDFQGATVWKLPNETGQVDLAALMARLAEQQINDVLIEAGAKLNGALLQAGLIDELIIYMAPKVMGDSARGLFHLPDMHKMADNIALTINDIRAVGQDWRITATPTQID